MAKGRKRKPGRRERNGRPTRAGAPRYDRGSERTADKLSVYGPDGSDAIGRAWHHGLLGDDGLVLRDAARAMFRAYWPMFAVGRYQCAIADKAGGSPEDDSDKASRREKWLADRLATIDRMGRETRRAFDQLCIDVNPDAGPAWLDRMIEARRRKVAPRAADARLLGKAIKALREIAS